MAGDVVEYVSPSRAGLASGYVINVFSPEILGGEMMCMEPSVADTVGGQNTAFYHPLILGFPLIIQQFFWVNGATVNGNTDMGVYSESGVLLVSTGTILNSGASAVQTATISPFTLAANRRYWLAIGSDSTTHTYSRLTLAAPVADYAGIKTNAAGLSGSVLITPTTFNIGVNSCIRCGIAGSAVL